MSHRSSNELATPRPTGGPFRILVVDDDPASCRLICRWLQARRYELDVVEDAEAALEQLATKDYDLVLSDLHLPGRSGLELLREVRQAYPSLPLVLLTGERALAPATLAVELGASFYVEKPLAREELLRVVTAALARRCEALRDMEARELLRAAEHQEQGRRELEAAFERALESLWMAFQPIVRAGDASVFAYEALMRCDEACFPHPGALLDAAEYLGRLPELGRRVRRRSAEAFLHAPDRALLFVNLHSRDLLDDTLMSPDEPLIRIAHRVVLEVTERARLRDDESVRDRLAALRELGFRIAIDDLGAGYAGLNSLAFLEPEIVKIDMSLVRGVDAHFAKQKLVRWLCELSRESGTLIVAEGVETTAERDAVTRLGCGLLQGFLLARPERAFGEVLPWSTPALA